jgi:hypothetical protein
MNEQINSQLKLNAEEFIQIQLEINASNKRILDLKTKQKKIFDIISGIFCQNCLLMGKLTTCEPDRNW